MRVPIQILIVSFTFGCSAGQLGQSEIEQPCAAGDSECEEQGASAPIAAGALFSMQFRPVVVGGTTAAINLQTVDPSVVVLEDARLRAVDEGITAVLALLDDGTVVDFSHVTVVKPTRATLHRGGGGELDEREIPDAIQVFPGEELTLSLRVWRESQELAGDLEDAWSVDNPAFLVVNQGFPQERRLRVPQGGNALLTINAVGLTKTLALEVVQ